MGGFAVLLLWLCTKHLTRVWIRDLTEETVKYINSLGSRLVLSLSSYEQQQQEQDDETFLHTTLYTRQEQQQQ